MNASVMTMPSKGFGKGRPARGSSAMIFKSYHMPPEMVEQIKQQAQKESVDRRVPPAEIVRKAVDAFFRSEQTAPKVTHSVKMLGVIFGGEGQKVQVAPDPPVLELPFEVGPKCHATIKRALVVLKKAELIGWNERFEPTKRGKMRQTSNEYFLRKSDPPSQIKNEPAPPIKVSDKTGGSEAVSNQANNGVVEEAISSPVCDEPEKLFYSKEEKEQWVKMLVAARLSIDDAQKYAGPEVPRILAWWETINKLKMRGIGLLINKLKDPSSLPIEAAPVAETPDVQNAGSREIWGEEAPKPSIEELRARATAQIEVCLSLLPPNERHKQEVCIAGFKFVSEKKNHLERWVSSEWVKAGAILDKKKRDQSFH